MVKLTSKILGSFGHITVSDDSFDYIYNDTPILALLIIYYYVKREIMNEVLFTFPGSLLDNCLNAISQLINSSVLCGILNVSNTYVLINRSKG